MIRTATGVSIKNYLRAVAEKNLDVIKGYYEDFQSGRIDKSQMVAMAGRLFASRTIGRTGYISSGRWPKPSVGFWNDPLQLVSKRAEFNMKQRIRSGAVPEELVRKDHS